MPLSFSSLPMPSRAAFKPPSADELRTALKAASIKAEEDISLRTDYDVAVTAGAPFDFLVQGIADKLEVAQGDRTVPYLAPVGREEYDRLVS